MDLACDVNRLVDVQVLQDGKVHVQDVLDGGEGAVHQFGQHVNQLVGRRA